MDFRPARPRRRPAEAIVPMINVVFLLLIFFLMTAEIAPQAAAQDEAAPEHILFLAADGTPSYGGTTGGAAWQALAGRAGGNAPLLIRADTDLPAATLARVMSRLAGLRITDVTLATRPR